MEFTWQETKQAMDWVFSKSSDLADWHPHTRQIQFEDRVKALLESEKYQEYIKLKRHYEPTATNRPSN